MATKKKWIAFDFDQCPPEKCPKTSTETNGTTTKKSQKQIERDQEEDALLLKHASNNNFNFFKKIEPQSIEDLAVHVKKINEVETWLDHFVLGIGPIKKKEECSLLLITGPSGCGKTATVRVLCKQRSIGITEWINPINASQQGDFKSDYNSVGQATRFLDYLSQSSFPSLISSNSKSICVVKDFPNTFIRSPGEFERILEEVSTNCKVTVIFIANEIASSSLNIEKNLFPDSVKMKFNIGTINFNACAATLMKNAVKRAQKLVKEHLDIFKIPSDDVIDGVCGSSMGDIRCAMNQFYLAALKGTNSMSLEIKRSTETAKSGAKRKRTTKTITLKNKWKDESLGLFHSIGRVLSAKLDPKTNKIQCDLDALIDELSTQPNIFLSFLFENYTRHFGDIGDTMRASEFLSTSQTLMEKWSERHDSLIIGLWVSVMGLMLNNKHKISKWNPIRGPVKIEMGSKKIAIENGTKFVSPLDFSYYNTITKSNKFHKFVFKS